MITIKYIDELVHDIAETKATIEVNTDFYDMLKKITYQSKKEVFEDINNMKSSFSKQFRDSFEFEMLRMKHLGKGD